MFGKNKNYKVVYRDAELEPQTITTEPVSFEEANDIAAHSTAYGILNGWAPEDGSYDVQPISFNMPEIE